MTDAKRIVTPSSGTLFVLQAKGPYDSDKVDDAFVRVFQLCKTGSILYGVGNHVMVYISESLDSPAGKMAFTVSAELDLTVISATEPGPDD